MTLQTFSGIVFLAAMAVIYRFSHKKLRLPVLLAASIACYAMFSLQMLGMLAAAVAISYVFAICIEKAGAPGALLSAGRFRTYRAGRLAHTADKGCENA